MIFSRWSQIAVVAQTQAMNLTTAPVEEELKYGKGRVKRRSPPDEVDQKEGQQENEKRVIAQVAVTALKVHHDKGFIGRRGCRTLGRLQEEKFTHMLQ